MTMKFEDIQEGVYVHWIADRYMGGWDIHGKIVEIEPDGDYEGKPYHRVTILGFDDMKNNTVGHTTVMDECTIATKADAVDYFERRILKKREAILDILKQLSHAQAAMSVMEDMREKI
jgi:hypothetical protein